MARASYVHISKLHLDRFWYCHHRNRYKMLHLVALSLVMDIFEKVEPYSPVCLFIGVKERTVFAAM